MPPREFSVCITGGSVPPTPSAIHALSCLSDRPDKLVTQSMIRSDGPPYLSPFVAKHVPVDDHSHLVEELHSILKVLPREVPPGSEDIYGMDTSIIWVSENLEWANAGPQGFSGGNSSIRPTPEETVRFKRAVDIVTELAQKARPDTASAS
ncbi:hypothetical protein FRC10_002937 [Ceratobasidium sp. 414]|nr:hypothetical protein FRC10_002937 [Ceratobasidium sp. 414]